MTKIYESDDSDIEVMWFADMDAALEYVGIDPSERDNNSGNRGAGVRASEHVCCGASERDARGMRRRATWGFWDAAACL